MQTMSKVSASKQNLAQFDLESVGITVNYDDIVVEPLTPSELVVLQNLPRMLSYSEIATGLFLSTNTVKTHVKAIYRKFGVCTRRDAVMLARSRGIISTDLQ